VLGKKDFKAILKWRTTMRELLKTQKQAQIKEGEAGAEDEGAGEAMDASSSSSGEEEEDVAKTEEVDQQLVDSALSAAETAAKIEARRLKRKKAKVKAKLREKMSLQADMPTDVQEITGDQLLFNLRRIDSKAGLDAVDEVSRHCPACPRRIH